MSQFSESGIYLIIIFLFVCPEMILQYAQDSLAVEVLLNPTLFTLTQCLRNVLRSPTGAVHVIYAGASFEETGSWILQDGSFSAYNFYELVQTEEKMASHSRPSTATTLSVAQGDTCKGHSSIAEHLSAHDIVLHFHSERSGEWAALSNIFSSHQFEPISNSMTSSLIMAELNGSGSSGGGKVRRESPTKRRRHLFHFDLNPADSPDGVQGAAALIDYLGEKLGKYYSSRGTVSQARFGTSADSALVDSVGYIRLDRPTLYVFPGGQGELVKAKANLNTQINYLVYSFSAVLFLDWTMDSLCSLTEASCQDRKATGTLFAISSDLTRLSYVFIQKKHRKACN